MESLDDDWELSRDNAHPNARRLLKADFYWDVADDDSPFGNDTGWDTLEFYRAWVRHSDDDEDFLHQIFDEWDIDWEEASAIPDRELGERLEEEHHDILVYDDVVIALAFAQLVLEGGISRDTAALAARALERQALPAMIDFRGWSDPAERSARCAEMREVVQSAD